jgi:hypothetical protein
MGLIDQLMKTIGLMAIGHVPQNEGPLLLKKHMLGQLVDHLWPTFEAMPTHLHYSHFSDGRLGHGGQHGSGHKGC